MKKLLITCLFFLFACLPTAYGAEGITIPNASPQEVRAHLVEQAKEAGALVRDQNDTLLVVHTQPSAKRFRELWGDKAYLRHLYRFSPTENGTYVTYEMQAVNGDQSASFTPPRLTDYHGSKSIFAGMHLQATYERLILLRKEFGVTYLYGVMLKLKDGNTSKIAYVLPDTPCAEAGLKQDDVVTRFAGEDVRYLTDFGLLCALFECEIDARPLTMTILRDGKEQNLRIEPRRCTPEEYAQWQKRVFFDKGELENRMEEIK